MSAKRGSVEPQAAHPKALLALLADSDRLRVLAALILGTDTEASISQITGLAATKVRKSLERLRKSGLVESRRGSHIVVESVFGSALESLGETEDEFPGVERSTAVQLRRYFKKGKLVIIPSTRPRRLLVLDYLASHFEPGRRYPERDVNGVLRKFHGDVATLRRFLVDEGFLSRDGREYWRSGGGRFDVG